MHNTLVLVMSALFLVVALSFPAALRIKRIKPVRMKLKFKMEETYAAITGNRS